MERYVDKCGNAGDLLVGVAVENVIGVFMDEWMMFFVVILMFVICYARFMIFGGSRSCFFGCLIFQSVSKKTTLYGYGKKQGFFRFFLRPYWKKSVFFLCRDIMILSKGTTAK